MKTLLTAFACGLLMSRAFAQNTLSNGLIASYPFSGNANEAGGSGYDGIVQGATLAPDRYGIVNQAYYFNGSSNITFPADAFKNNNYTYAFWVKLDKIPGENQYACIISIGGDGADQAIGVCNGCLGGEGWGFISYPNISYATDILPEINKWYFITGTRVNNNVKFYINGKITGGAGTMASATYAEQSVAKVGSRYNNNEFFNGSIDDVMIYDRALAAEEVKELYNLARPVITGTATSQSYKDDMRIFPNPSANGIFQLSGELKDETISYSVINAMGENVIEKPSGNLNSPIDLSSFPKGVYYLRITQPFSVTVKKMVHQ